MATTNNNIRQNFTVKEGNKITVYALKGDLDMTVSSVTEPFVSEASIAHASRPKDIPLATIPYGKLFSSPMGNNITAKVMLPKALASKEEFVRQVEMLYDKLAAENN